MLIPQTGLTVSGYPEISDESSSEEEEEEEDAVDDDDGREGGATPPPHDVTCKLYWCTLCLNSFTMLPKDFTPTLIKNLVNPPHGSHNH